MMEDACPYAQIQLLERRIEGLNKRLQMFDDLRDVAQQIVETR